MRREPTSSPFSWLVNLYTGRALQTNRYCGVFDQYNDDNERSWPPWNLQFIRKFTRGSRRSLHFSWAGGEVEGFRGSLWAWLGWDTYGERLHRKVRLWRGHRCRYCSTDACFVFCILNFAITILPTCFIKTKVNSSYSVILGKNPETSGCWSSSWCQRRHDNISIATIISHQFRCGGGGNDVSGCHRDRISGTFLYLTLQNAFLGVPGGSNLRCLPIPWSH